MDIFFNLVYNPLMRRFLLILSLIILTSNRAYSLSLKKAPENTVVQSEQYKNITSQANVFYAENDIKSAFNLFLSIPEDERTAQNWL